MSLFDEEFPPLAPEQSEPVARTATESSEPAIAGESLNYSPAPLSRGAAAEANFPADLQISWSWLHGLAFLLFIVISLIAVQLVVILRYAPHQRLTQKQFEEFMLSQPIVSVGSTVVEYALLLFFLYMTLSVVSERPFWKTIGWRKIEPRIAWLPTKPIAYFLAGCGVSLLVALVTSLLHPPENTPIEQVFHHRQTALLFLGVAVLVAPLAEETIFRGYLYPLFVRLLSARLRFVGVKDASALHTGILCSIVLTGFLFGLMHGPQLGGAKSLIAVLSVVGIVFTLARALTGSVFASYLMHLGYNSLIAVFALIGTQGFTKLPPGH
jgi:uncharacterized protein